MRAVISVVGKDKIGILASVSSKCQEFSANVVDVTQTVLQDFFTMVMLVEIENKNFLKFVDDMENFGNEKGLKIYVMHEDIFNAMHTI